MGFKGDWEKLTDDKIFELTRFAQKVYPNFHEVHEKFVRRIFETYKETTCIFIQRTLITGFTIYQEWPDALNFIMIYLPFSKERNMKTIIQGRHLIPNKKIVWFDEKEMKARGIRLCPEQQ